MIRSSSNYAFPQAVVLVCGGCIMYTLQIDHVTLALARSLALRHRQPSSLVSVHEQVLQLPHEPAAMQLRHLYNLGSWVRM